MTRKLCCLELESAYASRDYPIVFRAVVRACQYCGHVIPEHQRDQYFVNVSDDERAELRTRLSGADTFDEIVQRLGAPNFAGTGCGPAKDKWVRWAQYTQLCNSFVFVVGEHTNGRLGFMQMPQIQWH